jgi:hypothetical protein
MQDKLGQAWPAIIHAESGLNPVQQANNAANNAAVLKHSNQQT